jgi:hypothetical protein
VILRNAALKLRPPESPVNAPDTGLEPAGTLPEVYVNVRYIGTGPAHNGFDIPNSCTIMAHKPKLFLVVVVANA